MKLDLQLVKCDDCQSVVRFISPPHLWTWCNPGTCSLGDARSPPFHQQTAEDPVLGDLKGEWAVRAHVHHQVSLCTFPLTEISLSSQLWEDTGMSVHSSTSCGLSQIGIFYHSTGWTGTTALTFSWHLLVVIQLSYSRSRTAITTKRIDGWTPWLVGTTKPSLMPLVISFSCQNVFCENIILSTILTQALC